MRRFSPTRSRRSRPIRGGAFTQEVIRIPRTRKIVALVAAAALAVAATGGAAHATTPPGQKGYEGKPGNQGGFHQAGQKGYEGQPGNQGGH